MLVVAGLLIIMILCLGSAMNLDSAPNLPIQQNIHASIDPTQIVTGNIHEYSISGLGIRYIDNNGIITMRDWVE